jgi:hypothetical protein
MSRLKSCAVDGSFPICTVMLPNKYSFFKVIVNTSFCLSIA